MSNTNFDSDLDSFLNFDNDPSSASSSKAIPSMSHQNSYASASTPQAFPQPSYEYDQLKQQTGLPIGGLANTFAVNQATGLHYRPGSQFVMPTQTLNMPLSNLDEYDFNRFEGNDMDFDADSPTMYYGNSNISPAQQAPPRIYPGMHTQQAAQAKIQQAQKQQQEIVRQQQKQSAGQQSLPSQPNKISSAAKDPHVEESISRLLSRMRQSSNASAADEDDDNLSGLPNVPRIKKDEDDMDDDEKLLNSEEGKKLTSKERRQLRNKVSARAFRSRRKEYIGQLEAEVAQKVQEANDLRVQNRQLMEENTRLTDLTRMLLSSNSFSGFLQELSNSGMQPSSIPQLQQQRRQLQAQQQQQQAPAPTMQKDVPAHSAAQQMHLSQNMTVGMTLVPETPIDMSMFGGNPAWNNPIPSNDYQVFSVTELPEPPRLDLSALTGKKAEPVEAERSTKDTPVISTHPVSPSAEPEPEQIVDDSFELDQEKHALFFAKAASESTTLTLPPRLFAQITKASFLSVSQPTSGSWTDLEKLCDGMDQSSERLAEFLPRP